MIIHVLDTSLEVIGIIEDYYSLVWAERYYVCGDFELELPITYNNSPLIQFGNFLHIDNSDMIMIIQDIKSSTGESNTNIVVKGDSAESILKRRVLLNPVNIFGDAEEEMYAIIFDNITSPMNFKRRIELFKFTLPTPTLLGTIDEQFDIQTVYDVITTICKSVGYGFRLVREFQVVDYRLAFTIYEGKNRSFWQSENTAVIFSDNFDNVISSSFYLSEKGKVNLVSVTTDDEIFPITEVVAYYETENPEELDRFEDFLITSINRDLGDGEDPLTDTEVLSIIRTRGRAIISDKKTVGILEGDFDIFGNFKYGVDFFMGDIVQCHIEGKYESARIIEMVQSYSTEGEKFYVAMDFVTVY